MGLGIPSSFGVGEGAHYLGSDALDPLWEELNRRGSVVFVHGDQNPNSHRWPNKFLGILVTEVPNETYRLPQTWSRPGRRTRSTSHLTGRQPARPDVSFGVPNQTWRPPTDPVPVLSAYYGKLVRSPKRRLGPNATPRPPVQ